jgi:hypothetical protein
MAYNPLTGKYTPDVTPPPVKKKVETKAQIDARIAATNAKVTEGLKPILEPKGYTIDPNTGFYNAPTPAGGNTNTGGGLTAEQIAAKEKELLAQKEAAAAKKILDDEIKA